MFVVLNKTDMNSNELRVGNWIKDRGGKTWQIDSWECHNKVAAKEPEFNTCGMLLRAHPLTEYIEYLKPIPLTEEWLLRFGFLVTYKKAEWTIGAFRVCKTFDADFVYPDWDINYIDLPYVHQLQNLYFALTGQELTIKEAEK